MAELKVVRNPFPASRQGDAPVPTQRSRGGERDRRDAGGWREVKKRRERKEMQRALAEAQERDDLDEEQREAIYREQLRLEVIAEQEAAEAQQLQASRAASDSEGVGVRGSSRVEYRIGTIAMFFMLALSVIVDGTQLLLQFITTAANVVPVAGQAISLIGQVATWILTFLAGAFFFIWFHLMGVGYFSGKRAFVKIASAFVMAVVELVPFINALPTLTIGVLAIILSSRSEDKLRTKSVTPGRSKRGARIPLGPQKLVRR